MVEKEGIPRFYIRCLAELEDFVNEVSDPDKVQLPTAFTTHSLIGFSLI